MYLFQYQVSIASWKRLINEIVKIPLLYKGYTIYLKMITKLELVNYDLEGLHLSSVTEPLDIQCSFLIPMFL